MSKSKVHQKWQQYEIEITGQCPVLGVQDKCPVPCALRPGAEGPRALALYLAPFVLGPKDQGHRTSAQDKVLGAPFVLGPKDQGQDKCPVLSHTGQCKQCRRDYIWFPDTNGEMAELQLCSVCYDGEDWEPILTELFENTQ